MKTLDKIFRPERNIYPISDLWKQEASACIQCMCMRIHHNISVYGTSKEPTLWLHQLNMSPGEYHLFPALNQIAAATDLTRHAMYILRCACATTIVVVKQ